MSAGRGTPRVRNGQQNPSGVTIITSDRWISQAVPGTGARTLTADFEDYPLNGYQVLAASGALRAGIRFNYVPAEVGAVAEFAIQIGNSQLLAFGAAPVVDGYKGQLALYIPSVLLPAADADLTPIESIYEVPVPVAGLANLVMTVTVRETASSFGTFEIERVFCCNFGYAAPIYPVG